MLPDYDRRPMDRTASEPKNFHEYLESVGWELPEDRLASHRHFLQEAEEAGRVLGKIIDQNEGISFSGGGHFSKEQMTHLTEALRAIKAACTPMASLKAKAPKPMIRIPR